ncbi:MAG: SCP2 sterol-binding domain-containing protein [Gammaproteobacteria bacterium]|nr:SCP2 sterol-binding domain-containing protein [Gammaproteobacteria bacterium]
MNHANELLHSPRLPGFLATPLRLIPARLYCQLMPVFLNKLLSQQINEGDLDFLENRLLNIKVSDMGICLMMSFSQGRIINAANSTIKNKADASIQASLYDFLILAARQQDPDTLVFQRRLIMQGETELGLELKNFLDGLDLESTGSFKLLETALQKSLPIYRRLFS